MKINQAKRMESTDKGCRSTSPTQLRNNTVDHHRIQRGLFGQGVGEKGLQLVVIQ
ncbi:hypothetical protein GCM10029964_091760 [Kibdelosporangium lantanae]